MKFVVHIGMEKTGTTSIQRFVDANQNQLLRHGVLVPRALGSTPPRSVVMMGLEEGIIDRNHRMAHLHTVDEVMRFKARVTEELHGELATASQPTVLVTNELLSSKLDSHERVARFLRWLSQFTDEIEVLVYLRRQDSMFTAMYSTLIKVGYRTPFEATNLDAVGPDTKYDYLAVLRRWSAGNDVRSVNVRVFDRAQLVGADAVHDFVAQLHLPPGEFVYPDQSNTSLDASCIEFLRRFNEHVPYIGDDGWNPERGDIISALERISDPAATLGLPPSIARDMVERFAAGNAEIARTYLGRPDGRLFSDAYPSSGASTEPLILDEAVRISASLWLYQQRRLMAQSRRIGRLRRERNLLRDQLSAGASPTPTEDVRNAGNEQPSWRRWALRRR